MEMSEITSLIGSLGFPIVAYFLMLREMSKTREDHRSEMQSMTDALNNNTRVLERLEARLEARTDVQ